MPYSTQHKKQTRKRIVESARILFNRHGFHGVTIDMIMEDAGLTRGGFYNHFKNKEALHSEAVASFLMGRGAVWRDDAGLDTKNSGPENAQAMIDGYLSRAHLKDLDGQCPMIALPSDVGRANTEVGASYQMLFEAMVQVFETGIKGNQGAKRTKALAVAAMCVGGMVVARTLPDPALAEELRGAAQKTAATLAAT